MYAVYMNCSKMSNNFETHKEAYDELVRRLRKKEAEGKEIIYGVNCFVADSLIWEICEVKEGE